MSYYFSKKTHAPFDDVLARVTDGLKKEGFGILTDVDASGPLGGTLDIEFQKYRISGACHHPPDCGDATPEASEAVVELSCYVIAQGLPGGTVKVAAVEPDHTMHAAENLSLTITAEQVRTKLYHLIANI